MTIAWLTKVIPYYGTEVVLPITFSNTPYAVIPGSPTYRTAAVTGQNPVVATIGGYTVSNFAAIVNDAQATIDFIIYGY